MNQWEKNNSINFMWIGPSHTNQRYVFSDHRYIDSFEGLHIWFANHPSSQFNLYYDHNHVTDDMILRTQEKFPKFVLKDIYSIPMVQNNTVLFQDTMPLYWRIDLLKFIIILHEIEHEGKIATLFADFPKKEYLPGHQIIEKGKLFSDYVGLLQEEGIIAANRENQFIQIVNDQVAKIVLRDFIAGHFRAVRYMLESIEWGGSIQVGCSTHNVSEIFNQKSVFQHLDNAVFTRIFEINNMYHSLKDTIPYKIGNELISYEQYAEWYCPIDYSYSRSCAFPFNLNRGNNKMRMIRTSRIKYPLSSKEQDPFARISYPCRTDVGHGSEVHKFNGILPFTWLNAEATIAETLEKDPSAKLYLSRPNNNQVTDNNIHQLPEASGKPSQNKVSFWGKLYIKVAWLMVTFQYSGQMTVVHHELPGASDTSSHRVSFWEKLCISVAWLMLSLQWIINVVTGFVSFKTSRATNKHASSEAFADQNRKAAQTTGASMCRVAMPEEVADTQLTNVFT